MSYFASDTPISEPYPNSIEAHVEMGGFAFNAKEGIFIPIRDTDLYSDLPFLDPEVVTGDE